MKIGRMRHKVELHEVTKNQDGYGEQVPTYTKYDDVWAEIEPLTGRELLHAQQVSAELTVRIRIRYHGTVKSEDRVIYGDRTFEVVGPPINKDERGAEMILMCKEIEG